MHHRHREHRAPAGAVHALRIHPPVFCHHVGHEDDLSAREGETNQPRVAGDVPICVRLGPRTAKRGGHQLVRRGIVQENPCRPGPEHLLDRVENGFAGLLDVQPGGERQGSADKRPLFRTQSSVSHLSLPLQALYRWLASLALANSFESQYFVMSSSRDGLNHHAASTCREEKIPTCSGVLNATFSLYALDVVFLRW
jgi:hypothetical protein